MAHLRFQDRIDRPYYSDFRAAFTNLYGQDKTQMRTPIPPKKTDSVGGEMCPEVGHERNMLCRWNSVGQRTDQSHATRTGREVPSNLCQQWGTGHEQQQAADGTY